MLLDTLLFPILLNVACASFDGGAMMYSHHLPPIDPGQREIVLKETGPVKHLVGPYPTYTDFLMAGAAEVVVMTAISYGMKRMGWNRYWWIPQIGVSGIHFYCGIDNLVARHRCMETARKAGIF